jgi:hypothetical protein
VNNGEATRRLASSITAARYPRPSLVVAQLISTGSFYLVTSHRDARR